MAGVQGAHRRYETQPRIREAVVVTGGPPLLHPAEAKHQARVCERRSSESSKAAFASATYVERSDSGRAARCASMVAMSPRDAGHLKASSGPNRATSTSDSPA